VARKPHRLKENYGIEAPHNVIFVDTESYAEEQENGDVWHTLRLGVACYWRYVSASDRWVEKWLVFYTAAEFWDWVETLLRKKTRFYIVSHNLDFDMPMLDTLRELEARGFGLTHFYKKGIITLARYKRDSVTLQFMDNLNLFAADLRSLGETLGSSKLHVDFSQVGEDELITYCKQDVQILVEAWRSWLQFLRDYDLGVFAPTLAGQAFNAYRHKFMHYPIFIHDDDEATALEREAYHGGRTECFRVGRYRGQTYRKLDVNAMYPAVMHDHEYPCKLLAVKRNVTVDRLRELLQRYCCIAKVRVRPTEPVFVHYVNGWLCYPTGEFETVLCTRELLYAFERNWVLDVEQVAVYERAPLFREWVEWIYGLEQEAKREGDQVKRYQAKILRNSLYGKFGQRGLERKCLGPATSAAADRDEVYVAESKEWVVTYNFAGYRWEDRVGEAAFNSFVAIAAEVTANARLKLWELIKEAGQDHVYYSDTDSVIVDEVGFERLKRYIDPGRLGYLKVEKEATELAVHCAKDYQLGDDVKRKGISKDAIPLSETLYQQYEWSSLLQTYRTTTPNVVRVHLKTKRLRREIHTGVVQLDGRVVPFHIHDGDTGIVILNDPQVAPF